AAAIWSKRLWKGRFVVSAGVALLRWLLDGKPKCVRHSHQIGECLCVEFFHDVMTMYLYRNFADPELRCGLFIHQARDDQTHDLLLARPECFERIPKSSCVLLVLTSLAIPLERISDGIQ